MKKKDGAQDFYAGVARGVFAPLEIIQAIVGNEIHAKPPEGELPRTNTREYYLGIMFGIVTDIGLGWALYATLGETLGRSIGG